MDLNYKYIGTQDIKYLFDVENQDSKENRPVTANSSTSNDTALSIFKQYELTTKDSSPRFTPFTPKTLDCLITVIRGTKTNIENITFQIYNTGLGHNEKGKVSLF